MASTVVTHGKNSTYTGLSCRCEDCTRAHRDYQNKFVRRTKKVLTLSKQIVTSAQRDAAREAAKKEK